MILLAAASHILWHASHTSASLIARQEALESARIAIDALTVSLQLSDKITLETEQSGMLRRLTARQINPEGFDHAYVFYFNSTLSPGALRYRRLDLGNQELTSNIRAVYIILSADHKVINITVISCDSLGEPIILTGAVNVQYKILN